MHTTAATTLFLAVAVSLAHTEELKASDVPNACQVICGPMVTPTSTCDVDPDTETRRRRERLRHRAADDDDNSANDESDEVVEARCICNNTSFNVRSVAALCAACISQNGKTTDATETETEKRRQRSDDAAVKPVIIGIYISIAYAKCSSDAVSASQRRGCVVAEVDVADWAGPPHRRVLV
ncbi:uncharacterized protein C8A04DRAFT_24983 [Dichotomopilus funicola]|uniref:Uncharacterized protein n=1 Tax=Dichotomopilus funicola TaxID=1934379 RepID=A0AAN6ZPR4_9PEZI|nr:hypothetical protein C8A04DRAFT_24983 [Dichotomopilus funicola]